MASVIGEQAAGNILNLQSRRKPPTSNHEVEGLDRLWLDLEKQLARIPLDKDGSTLQDEDEVQISQQLLAMDDVPFDYCLKPFYHADEFPKWISRRQNIQAKVNLLRTLLSKWVTAFPASDMEHWCKLPAMLRYAMKRPLMPQRDLENKLKELGFYLPPRSSRMMRALSGREQNLQLEIDIDRSRSCHLRTKYHDRIAHGWLPPDQNIEAPKVRTTQDIGAGSDAVGDIKAQDEGDLHQQLQKMYVLFQKGTSEADEAINRYNYLLGSPDISNSDLASLVKKFGIPKEHIMGLKTEPKQAILHDSLQQIYKLLRDDKMSLENGIIWYRYLLDQPIEPLSDLANHLKDHGLPREHILEKVCEEDSSYPRSPAEDKELKIVADIRNFVVAYRSGSLELEEATSFASERLEGLKIDHPYFSWLISSENLTPTQAAQAIFESAAEEARSPSPPHQTDPEEIKDLKWIAEHFLELYVEDIVDGLDPGIALAEYRDRFDLDKFQPHEVSFILAQLQGHDDNAQDVSGMTTTSEVGNAVDKDSCLLSSSMPPPEIRKSRERSPSLGSETLAQSDTSGGSSVATLCNDTAAQDSVLAVAEWEQSFSGTAGNPENCDYDALSSSPENGFSTDLWGLKLPTATAKKLALDIGLPTDYVNRCIRSLTPVRASSTKARKMGSSPKSSPIKRKASATLHQGRQIRPPKFKGDPVVSAQDIGTYDASVQRSYAAGASTSRATGQSSSDLASIRTSASLSPPISSASSDPKVDTSSIFKGILAANPCSHKSSGPQIDVYELYFGKSGLLHDPRFVKQLFVCPECSKPNGREARCFVEPMKGPQRLRLTQPKKRLRDVPFFGTAKDMSYSAAVNCQSFFVGLETRRRRRQKANLSATNDRYFQNPISSPSSSGSTSQLNKLFEKYKGIPLRT